MPRGDRRGPDGLGTMTGRGAGYCAGYTVPGFMNSIGSRGGAFGGRGRGNRMRNRFYGSGMPGRGRGYDYPVNDGLYAAELTADQELKLYKNQAAAIQEELTALQKRIKEIEEEKNSTDS